MRGMPGPGDAATWGGRTYDYSPGCYQCLYGTPHKRGTCPSESKYERSDDGAPEFYDIETGATDDY